MNPVSPVKRVTKFTPQERRQGRPRMKEPSFAALLGTMLSEELLEEGSGFDASA